MQRANLTKAAKKLVAMAVGLLLTYTAQADQFEFEHNDSMLFYAHPYSNERNDFFNRELVPISLMSDESLFLAVEAELDDSMSYNQKVLNNRWLAADSRNTFTGGAALRRFVRLSFSQQLKSDELKSYVLRERTENEDSIEIFSLNNYRLSVRDDRIRLKYRQRFSLQHLGK